MIALQHITKEFCHKGRVTSALRDVSLTVVRGGVTGVIGESGAGKSTLIRCVNLPERPTAGKVVVDGQDLMRLPSRELLKVRRGRSRPPQSERAHVQPLPLARACSPFLSPFCPKCARNGTDGKPALRVCRFAPAKFSIFN